MKLISLNFREGENKHGTDKNYTRRVKKRSRFFRVEVRGN